VKLFITASTWLSLTLALCSVTVFSNPFNRLQSNQTPKLPILQGSMQDDGTIWALGYSTLRQVLEAYLLGFAAKVTDDEVLALYPGQNETQVMSSTIRDFKYRWYVEYNSRP
jgi:hypothetical protein